MQPPNVPVESYQIVGSLQIGVFFNLILLGAVVVQAAAYFRRCRRDSLIFKILVALVLTLEIVHSICASLSIYYFTVIIADISDPRKPRSSYFLASVAVIEPLSTALVQGFFCFRIYRLSGNIYTTGLTGLFSGFRVSTGLFLGYRAFRDVPLEPAFLVFQHEWDWLLTAAFVVGALADLTIACTLCYHVNKLASPLVMKTSGGVLNGIFLRSLQTGLITSLASVTVLICFQTMEDTFTWIGMYIVLAKLYSNALLSSLNARYSYRRMMNVDAGSETSVNSQEISVTRLRRNTHPGVIELRCGPIYHNMYQHDQRHRKTLLIQRLESIPLIKLLTSMSKRKQDKKNDDSDSDSDVSLIDVDFDFFDPNPSVDYHALKRLIGQLFQRDVDLFHTHELTELVLSQPRVGTTIKTDGMESDPYALLTVLNMHKHKDHPSIKALAHYFLDKSSADPAFHATLQGLFSQTESHVGFVLCERLINMPVQVVPPMFRMLMDELKWAIDDNEPYTFSHLIFISRTYHLSEDEEAMLSSTQTKPHKTKRTKKASAPTFARPADGIYSFHPEDEHIRQASIHAVDYAFSTSPTEPRDKESFGLDTRGRMMLVPAEHFPALVGKMSEAYAVG